MRYSIHDYTKSMSRIMPSESFISDTEALMKKVRDEQLAQKQEAPAVSQTQTAHITMTSNASNGRKKGLRYAAAVLSTAAAAVICITAVNLASRSDDEDDMALDTAPAATEAKITEESRPAETVPMPETEAAETEQPSEDKITDENDSESDFAYNTVPVEPDDIGEKTTSFTSREPELTAAETERTLSQTETEESTAAQQSKSISEKSEAAETQPSYDDEVSAANYTDEQPLMAIQDTNENYCDDSVSADDSAGTMMAFGDTPMYVPDFYGVEEYETADEDIEEDSADGGYDTASPEVYTIASYEHSFAAADEVYVPDSISGLESGSYQLTISAGFDDYDEATGTVSSGAEADISADNGEELAQIMYAVETAVNGKNAVYSDSEASLPDYRYRISVYSAADGENGALLFEILYNDSTLVINRFDNGTVSSEKYLLSQTDYKQTDSIISAKFKK